MDSNYSKNKDSDNTNSLRNPSIKEWKELYTEAVEFKEIAPWNWMWDTDIFGVKDPVTGEIGYC